MAEIKKNDEYVMEIMDLGADGEGIGKLENGYTVFVKDALIGDVAKIKIIKTKKNYGYGRLMALVKASPYRVEAPCPVARACGGCQIMHLDYAEQLKYKENKLRNLLERVGKVTDYEMAPVIGMKEPYYYRNKAQFPVGKNKDGEIITGFYAGRTHSIIDTTHCFIQHPLNEMLVTIVREWMGKNGVEPYDEATGRGLVRHILTRVGKRTGEVMVCLVINGKDIPAKEALITALTGIEGMKSICLNVNREKTNVILGPTAKTLWGNDYITDYIGRYMLSDFAAVLLSGKSGSDTDSIFQSAGICRTEGGGCGLGSVLRDRNYFPVPGPEGRQSVWRGDRAPGHCGCEKECGAESYG